VATVVIKHTNAEYGFTAIDQAGNVITMDKSTSEGQSSHGISPMQGLLISLGGCSGIDIVSILKKQRQSLNNLTIEVRGEREQDSVPALWKTIHMRFVMEGHLLLEKAEHAARLSVEKYCSVAETLRRAGCIITWDVSVI
jgi:putative redox protein